MTIQPADRTGRVTKIDRAAARKRLLFARYAGWANSGARYPRGRLGPACEAAVRAALADSGQLQPRGEAFLDRPTVQATCTSVGEEPL